MAVKWYAARTKPMAEYLARYHLEATGVEVFMPCAQILPKRPGHQESPLFPGYLFVHYDLEDRGAGFLRRCPELLGLVQFGGEVPAIPDEVIDYVAQQVNAINGTGGLWHSFQPGETVRVTLGPTESLAEVIEGAKSPNALVRVLLELLGRVVEAKVPWRNVQPLSANGIVWNWTGKRPRRTRGNGRWIRGHGPRTAMETVGTS